MERWSTRGQGFTFQIEESVTVSVLSTAAVRTNERAGEPISCHSYSRLVAVSNKYLAGLSALTMSSITDRGWHSTLRRRRAHSNQR